MNFINNIIAFSVHNRIFVFIATLILIIGGIYSFDKLAIDAVPDITNTQVQVNTGVEGLTPEEIERMITFPIESALTGMPGVEQTRSVSKYGISQVTVIFSEDTDIYLARQLTSEKLANLELPEGVTPAMGPISTGLGEIFHYSLKSKKILDESTEEEILLNLMELRSIQDWFIKPRLLTVKGVTEVNTTGGYEKQYFIQPDIKKMSRYGIHFDDIENAIKSTNINVGGGYIPQSGEQLLVRGVGLLNTISDIENVVIKRLGSLEIIRVKDIAKVKFDKEIRTGAATHNGQEVVVGTAFMLLGENSRAVSIRLKDKIDEIKKNLPEWVELEVVYNRSEMVNATLSTVEHNLIIGAGLVMAFLMLLVGNIRAAIIVAATIPISLLITFILMRWQNVSGNLMSLGALDFGIIVDGAVIVIENCVHRIQKRTKELGKSLTRAQIKELVIESAIEIRSAAGFGELIVIVVFIPLFALTGIEGKMFGPMAMTFIMALASALVLSFTLVPALAATFLSSNTRDQEPKIMSLAKTTFAPILNIALKFKKVVLGLGVSAIALGIFLFSSLGSEFIPQLDEGDFAVQFIRPANISIENSIALQRLSEDVIKEFPQVKNAFGRTGAGEISTDPMGVNISDTYVMLWPKKEWPKGEIKSKQDLIKHMREKLDLNIPAQVAMFSQPVELRFNEILEGARSKVSAKVYGDDLMTITRIANQVAASIKNVPGAGEVEVESKGMSPVIEYTPKLDELAKLGVSSKPVLDVISTAIGGTQVGSIYDGVKKYPIVTRLSGSERRDVQTISNLPVGISDGYTVKISDVADIDFSETYSSINRENSVRRLAILINPKDRDIESFVKLAQKEVSKIELPEGYYIEWGGSFKNLISAKKRLSVLVPLSLLLILVMLYGAFKNYAQVILIFLCAPMALIGGVLSLKILGLPFSISAGVGFIALCGISILNGVVLVTYFNRLLKDGKSADDVVREGTMIRLRPVLMTALTDIFGFLPMIFSTGLGAEVQRPLATVVVGGIISATVLTLIVLPSLYRLFIDRMQVE